MWNCFFAEKALSNSEAKSYDALVKTYSKNKSIHESVKDSGFTFIYQTVKNYGYMLKWKRNYITYVSRGEHCIYGFNTIHVSVILACNSLNIEGVTVSGYCV